MPNEARSLKVFLCHAHNDKRAVHDLYLHLTQHDIDAWLDKEKLLPGQDWEYEIRKAVRESDVVVVCLSKQFNQAGFRQKEVRLALDTAMEQPEGEIFIIPARLEECDTLESLRKWHWVDLYEPGGYENLIRALRARANRVGATLRKRKRGGSKITDAEIQKAAGRSASNTGSSGKTGADSLANQSMEKKESDIAEEVELEQAAREDLDREAAEKGENEKVEREDVGKAQRGTQFGILWEKLSRILVTLKPSLPRTNSLMGIAGVIGTAAILFWISYRVMPQIFSPVPTPSASVTSRPNAPSTLASSPVAFTKTAQPSATPTILSPTALPAEFTDSKGVQMMLVQAGGFIMGRDNGEEAEQPAHRVYLDAFYMDRFEVTNARYEECVTAAVCDPPHSNRSYFRSSYYGNSSYDEFPVIYINWYQAKTYCEWRGARLPTEAEWEKAARGSDERTYPWGEDINCDKANYQGDLPVYSYCTGETARVGLYETGKSPYGLYDMAGNVTEWVSDWYSPSYYQSSPENNPTGPDSGESRVIRGGAWNSGAEWQTMFRRNRSDPTSESAVGGFRCAVSP